MSRRSEYSTQNAKEILDMYTCKEYYVIMQPGKKDPDGDWTRYIVPDEKPVQGDIETAGRQNIYGILTPEVGKLYSARQVSQMTGYSPVTVRVLYRQLDMKEKVDGRPVFSVEDIRNLHNRRNRQKKAGVEMAKKVQVPRRPMDARMVTWELFESNRGRIERIDSVLKLIRAEQWELRKSISLLAGDMEDLKKRKEGKRGRGVSILGRTAPLTLNYHEATAA